MQGPTLKQLRYAQAVIRHGHFGRAAAALAISQPALSMQIRELETGLGAPLFERGARQVRLSAFGVTLAPRIAAALRAVEALEEEARAARDRLDGVLRLGVIPTVAPYLLPRVIRALSDSHSELDLQVRETVTPRLIEELAEGRLDAALVALPVSEPALTEVPLFEERFVLVRPGSEAGTPVPASEDLGRMRLLLLEEGHCFRDQALAVCKLDAAAPRDGLDGSSLGTLVQMVGAGLGITLIPEMAVPVESRAAPVSIAALQGPQPRRQLGLVWRRASPLASRLQEIAAVIRHAAATPATASAADTWVDTSAEQDTG